VSLDVMTVPGYKFAANTARMYPLANYGRTGWGFCILTDDAFEEPPEDDAAWGEYPYGLQLTTEQEPIPLPEQGDLTGVEFTLNDPTHPDGGDYFLFTPIDSHPVSGVRIRFLEREGKRYRVEFSGAWHPELGEPIEFRYDGWVNVTSGPDADD
jgi:hypothetical protein